MRFVWKGKFNSSDDLPKGVLPEGAVPYKEPKDMKELNKVASFFLIPVIIIIGLAILIKSLVGFPVDIFSGASLYGVVFGILTILPHEFLHGIAFPKKAKVEFWYSLKDGMAFVVSTHPVAKRRFIFISLLPNIIFGLIPLIAWIFIPSGGGELSSCLFTFAGVCLTFGVGDYMNVYNTITQVPKGANTQLSGFHSYWYM